MPSAPDNRSAHSKVIATLRESFGDAGPFLGLGIQLGLIVAVYTIGGYLLDLWLDTLPWLTVAGAGAGMVTMFIHLVQVLNRMNRTTERNFQRKQEGDRKSGAG